MKNIYFLINKKTGKLKKGQFLDRIGYTTKEYAERDIKESGGRYSLKTISHKDFTEMVVNAK